MFYINIIIKFLFFAKFYLITKRKSFFTFDYSLFTIKSYMPSILYLFRNSSVFSSSIFLDLSAFERPNMVDSVAFSLFYLFYIPLLGIRISLNFVVGQKKTVKSMASCFQALEWAEREVSEMLGIKFLLKKDSRKLLLDYSFVGFPLLKHFPVVGLVELTYNFKIKWVMYVSLRLSESDRLRFLFNN